VARAPAHARPAGPLFARGELRTVGCALALLVTMVALPWFGADGLPGSRRTGVWTLSPFAALHILSWLLVAVIALAVATPVLHVTQRLHGAKTDTSLLLAVVSALLTVALADRVLVTLPDPPEVVDQKLGALIGLGWACALTVSAWVWARSVRRQRAAATAAPPAPAAGTSVEGTSAPAPPAPETVPPSSRPGLDAPFDSASPKA
jgi:hypothetical protein